MYYFHRVAYPVVFTNEISKVLMNVLRNRYLNNRVTYLPTP